jgi:uncharacterized protein YjbI with pentapeptide repeats
MVDLLSWFAARRLDSRLYTGLTVALFAGALNAAQPALSGELLGPEGVSIKADLVRLSTREVTSAVFKTREDGSTINLAGRTLRDLDLSGLDFRKTRLTGADMFGADLTSANLQKVDLSGVNLNRTIVIRADFSGANLSGATFMRPSVSTSLDYDIAESHKFAGADMRNIRMTSKMIGADFRGANLSGALMGPHEPRADLSSMPASILKSCDFSGATMTDVDLSRAVLMFSRFVGADLRRATLVLADLSKADLSGADLTGADLTDANLDGTNLSGVKGFDTVRGRDTIRNLDQAIR